MRFLLPLLILCLVFNFVSAYLPGLAPQNYRDGQGVEVQVIKLDSTKTQLPYEYYTLPFCEPEVNEKVQETLGEVLSGDVIESSPYEIKMRVVEACKVLCRRTYTDSELQQFSDKIEDEYRVNMLVDNLPAVTKYYTSNGDDNVEPETHFEKGFELGFVGSPSIPGSEPGVKYINNHIRLIVQYHGHEDPNNDNNFRVVGFEVEAFSVKHELSGEWKGNRDTRLKTCTPLNKVTRALTPQPVTPFMDDKQIIWSYDVQWESSNIKWVSRWDIYLKLNTSDNKIHWFSIFNSIMIILFLSGMVAVIMMKTLHKDLSRYNDRILSEEEQQEETGWKLIHGDVFRSPQYPNLLSILLGTGIQLFAMTLLTLAFAALGFLSPAHRGSLMMALLLLFVFMGMPAGYYATRLYTSFKLINWKQNTLHTAVFFPGVVFTIFFILNLFVWHENSSSAIAFDKMIALLVLWLGISVPLVYLGSYFANKKPLIEPPCKINALCRLLLPDNAWYTSPALSILVGGVLPFAAVFIELFFIMSSVWLNQFYYVFGILFIVFFILIITCAQISVVMCYFQLCNEDYHWWWRSFLTSGSSALYLFLYSILYFCTKLQIAKFVSGLLFFGYMLLVSITFFILTGTIGFVACWIFVRKIYSSIKVD